PTVLPTSTLFPYTTLFRSVFQPPKEALVVLANRFVDVLAACVGGAVLKAPERLPALLDGFLFACDALVGLGNPRPDLLRRFARVDGKSTRLNSSHVKISYA